MNMVCFANGSPKIWFECIVIGKGRYVYKKRVKRPLFKICLFMLYFHMPGIYHIICAVVVLTSVKWSIWKRETQSSLWKGFEIEFPSENNAFYISMGLYNTILQASAPHSIFTLSNFILSGWLYFDGKIFPKFKKSTLTSVCSLLSSDSGIPSQNSLI